MVNVTWRTHPLYTGYEASDDGRVRSKPRLVKNRWGSEHSRAGVELKTFIRKGGYLGGNISVDGKRINFELHVFVCECFHGPRQDPSHEVRHRDGNRLNNTPGNVLWATKVENAQDIIRHGRNHELNKTHCPSGHAYTLGNTYRAPGSPNKRHCRKCARINDQNRRPRRRCST